MCALCTSCGECLYQAGPLFLAFHVGDEVFHREEMWEVKVSLDFYFFRSDEMTAYLRDAGFEIEEIIERDPYPEAVEHQSRRSYILARKPAAGVMMHLDLSSTLNLISTLAIVSGEI